MENVIDDLNYRGLIEQYSNEDNVRKLLSEKQTIYCGFDPSASSMHLGNFVMISTLMRLQRAGHRIIAVVGGGTGMIGDPSGKSKERNLQNEDTLRANTASIKAQLERFLDLSDPEKGMIVNNYDWLGPMTTLDFLRDYGKVFSINYLLSKEIVSSRLEAGISFTEFSYQILQSIDFLTLYRKYGCKIQIGGNDQWGNLTSGLELIRKLEGDNAPCEVMTAHLLLRSDGKKFGKSEQGALFLDPKLTSPYQLYQYFINGTDEDAVKYLKVLTFLSKDEIEDIARDHIAHLKEEEIVELLGSLKFPLDGPKSLVDLLVLSGAAQSKTQARTFIEQNSVSINGEKVTDPNKSYSQNDALYGKYLIVRRGKKNYYLGVF